jgi:glycyl-tRNA synthetase
MELALRRGFFFPSSEIYPQAPAGFYEYGSLGVSIRNRYLQHWRTYLLKPERTIEIDGANIMAKDVFAASGHLEGFADLIVQCGKCHSIFRADRLVSQKLQRLVPERTSPSELTQIIRSEGIKCPNDQGELGEASSFSMMFAVQIGPNRETAYLRPETAQSIFVDFARIFKTMRVKLPFAIAQYGAAFRNEISPRQALIRLRELHQAEIEVFFNPTGDFSEEKFRPFREDTLQLLEEEESGKELTKISFNEALEKGILPFRLIAYYLARLQRFYVEAGVSAEKIRFRVLPKKEKAFYAEIGIDLEVKTSLGWTELVACNYRADFDLASHSKGSGTDLAVVDDGQKVIPHVFELSMGVDRSLYTILELSFVREAERTLLRLPRRIVPVDVGVLPLQSRDGLPEKAALVYDSLLGEFEVTFDDSGSIGRRYRRGDEIGVPAAVTVDYQTLKDETVTLRERDSMEQQRVSLADLKTVLRRFLNDENISQGINKPA